VQAWHSLRLADEPDPGFGSTENGISEITRGLGIGHYMGTSDLSPIIADASPLMLPAGIQGRGFGGTDSSIWSPRRTQAANALE